jgi:hypothetical protein
VKTESDELLTLDTKDPSYQSARAMLYSAIEAEQLVVLESELLKSRIEKDATRTESELEVLNSLVNHASQTAGLVRSAMNQLGILANTPKKNKTPNWTLQGSKALK